MSKYLLNSLKFTGGIFSTYLLSLAIAPLAQAETNLSNAGGSNVSNASGFNASQASGFAASSSSFTNGGGDKSGNGGDGANGGGTGSKSNEAVAANRLASIRAAQLLGSELDAAQSAYETASARVAQLLAQSQVPPEAVAPPKPLSVRYALKPSKSGDCGCENPDLASTPPDKNNAAELAARDLPAAKVAQAKAAADLAQAQARARQFLEANKAKTAISAGNTTFSPIW